MAAIAERMQADIVTAMKARDEHRLTTLRMVKSAMKNKEIEKRSPLEEAEEAAVLTTLIKQRRESIDQFTKGGRPELAEKEGTEIEMIEAYLPQAATEEEVRTIVLGALEHLATDAGGAAADSGERDPRRWRAGKRDGEDGAGEVGAGQVFPEIHIFSAFVESNLCSVAWRPASYTAGHR